VKINLNLKPIHDMNTTPRNSMQSNSALRQVSKLGLDVDLPFVVTQESPSLALCKNTVTGEVYAPGM